MRTILLISLLVFSKSNLPSLLAKQAELTANHDGLLDQMRIITDKTKNYSQNPSLLHLLLARLSDVKEATNTYSTLITDLANKIAEDKKSEANLLYISTDLKMDQRYSSIKSITDNVREIDPQLTTLIQNFKESENIKETLNRPLLNDTQDNRKEAVNLANQAMNLIKEEVRNSNDLTEIRTRIAQFSESNILANMILIEDAYTDEIIALDKHNRIIKQIEENQKKEKDNRIDYEIRTQQVSSEENFCLNSFLELAKYFGYHYSAFYYESAFKYMDNYKKIVRILLNTSNKFFLRQHDANLKRNIRSLKGYFVKINKKFIAETPFPASIEKENKEVDFSLPKEVTVINEVKLKNTIFYFIANPIDNIQNYIDVFRNELLNTFDLFINVIDQSEKIDEIWMEVDLIKNQIKQLDEKEQRIMYENYENLEKKRQLKLQAKQVRKELKDVNEEISLVIL